MKPCSSVAEKWICTVYIQITSLKKIHFKSSLRTLCQNHLIGFTASSWIWALVQRLFKVTKTVIEGGLYLLFGFAAFLHSCDHNLGTQFTITNVAANHIHWDHNFQSSLPAKSTGKLAGSWKSLPYFASVAPACCVPPPPSFLSLPT